MGFKSILSKFKKNERQEEAKKHYLTGKEIKVIAKANAQEMRRLEKAKNRKVPPEEYMSVMKDENNVLEVENLHSYFFTDQGVVKAVNGVTFNIPVNSTVGVVGESGCGKSVTSQSILRLYDEHREARHSGEVLFENDDLLKLSQKEIERRRGSDIAMIFHS